MTSLQIVAIVVVCVDIGIVLAALLWPESHRNEHPDGRAAISATAGPTAPAVPARPHRDPGRTGMVRTLLENSWAFAQRYPRRHSA
jgi:hypothetical protein